jgi:hypothetical protein
MLIKIDLLSLFCVVAHLFRFPLNYLQLTKYSLCINIIVNYPFLIRIHR